MVKVRGQKLPAENKSTTNNPLGRATLVCIFALLYWPTFPLAKFIYHKATTPDVVLKLEADIDEAVNNAVLAEKSFAEINLSSVFDQGKLETQELKVCYLKEHGWKEVWRQNGQNGYSSYDYSDGIKVHLIFDLPQNKNIQLQLKNYVKDPCPMPTPRPY